VQKNRENDKKGVAHCQVVRVYKDDIIVFIRCVIPMQLPIPHIPMRSPYSLLHRKVLAQPWRKRACDVITQRKVTGDKQKAKTQTHSKRGMEKNE
jgi:hypothetical protein